MGMRKSLVLIICMVMLGVLNGITYASIEEDMDGFFQAVSEPTRNNYSGVTGIQFTMNEDTYVWALGRPITIIFKQEHTLTLWRVSDEEIVAEVVVGPESPVYGVSNGTYVYEMLDSQIQLVEGESYRLMSEEFSGGDNWATCYMVTPGKEITDIANIDGIPYGPTGLYPTNYDATPNKVDIGCTFFYGEAKAVNSAGKLRTTWAKLKDISD